MRVLHTQSLPSSLGLFAVTGTNMKLTIELGKEHTKLLKQWSKYMNIDERDLARTLLSSELDTIEPNCHEPVILQSYHRLVSGHEVKL